MRTSPTIVVVAPSGTGKTRLAQQLANRFGCTAILDEWDGVSELPAGTLALTNIDLHGLTSEPVAERP